MIKMEWNMLLSELAKHLIFSVESRTESIIESNGGYTTH